MPDDVGLSRPAPWRDVRARACGWQRSARTALFVTPPATHISEGVGAGIDHVLHRVPRAPAHA